MNPNTGVCTWDSVIAGTTINSERSDWRAALQEGSGVLVHSRLYVSQQCALAAEAGRRHPGVHQRQCNQPVKRTCYPTVLSIGAASL